MAERNPYTKQLETNPYATGKKRYGLTQSIAAQSGPISAAGRTGYADRDAALLRKKARQKSIGAAYGTSPSVGYSSTTTTL